MRKISLENKPDGNQLVIKCDYDPAIIYHIKTLPGRTYNVALKAWLVPKLFVKEVIYALKPLQFDLSPEVEELAKGEAKRNITLNLPLYDFQKAGAEFLMNNRFCLLGDDMGIGKSIMAIATCEELKIEKVLVITMASLKFAFEAEIKKWYSDASTQVVNGRLPERIIQYKSDAKYFITNYELVRQDIEILSPVKWPMIICDEATKISNPKAKQSRAIKLLQGERKLAMTGTPINNTPTDLFGIYDFLLPGLLGNFWQFRQQYCETDYWGNVTAYQNLAHLQKRIAPYFLRRTKAEVLKELPDKTYVDIPVELSAKEKKIYKAVKTEILHYLNVQDLSKIDFGTINNALTKLVRLKQITSHLSLVGDENESSKLEALKELLESVLVNGRKCVIWTQFAKMADILESELNAFKPLKITGAVKVADRPRIVANFAGNSENLVLVATSAGGFGLNLQRADTFIFYDLPWSISKKTQAEDRIHRIGQKANVVIYSLLAKDSVDYFVRDILHAKNKTAKEMFEGIKKILS